MINKVKMISQCSSDKFLLINYKKKQKRLAHKLKVPQVDNNKPIQSMLYVNYSSNNF